MEALRPIDAERAQQLVGLLVLNALDMQFKTLKLRRDPKCPACGDFPTITKLIDYAQFCGLPAANPSKPVLTAAGITLNINPATEVHPTQLKQMLDAKADFLLLDCRQPREWSTCHIDGAKLIPLDQLESQLHNIDDFEDRPIIIHCHHGGRSLAATMLLRQKGFKHVHSLAGGIDAWSLLIDPSVRRY